MKNFFLFVILVSFSFLYSNENKSSKSDSLETNYFVNITGCYKYSFSEINFDVNYSNFGHEYSFNNDFVTNNTSLLKNLVLTFKHKFYSDLVISAGLSAIQFKSNSSFNSLSISVQKGNSSFGFLKMGYTHDLDHSNRKWSTSYKTSDGFDRLLMEYYYEFDLKRETRLKSIFGLNAQIGDDYKNPNNYDIQQNKKYNEFNGLYFNNTFTKRFEKIEIGIEIQYNYLVSFYIGDKRKANTNGYLFSISPLMRINSDKYNTFFAITTFSTYENIRYGIPIYGKNSLAPFPTVSLTFGKKWEF